MKSAAVPGGMETQRQKPTAAAAAKHAEKIHLPSPAADPNSKSSLSRDRITHDGQKRARKPKFPNEWNFFTLYSWFPTRIIQPLQCLLVRLSSCAASSGAKEMLAVFVPDFVNNKVPQPVRKISHS